MTLTKTLLATALAFGFSTGAQAEEPCGPGRPGAAGGLVGGLAPVLADMDARQNAPCSDIKDRISATQRQIAQNEQLRKAADIEVRYWAGRANTYLKGQSAIIERDFGKNILVTTTLISTELVLDAFAAGKAVKGAGYAYKASTMTGAVRSAMMGVARRQFQEALASAALSKGQAVLNGIQNPNWSWWELIPFVSPLKKLNRMAGTDDAVADLGKAQRFASNESNNARRRRTAADDRLEGLRQRLGALQQQLGRCQSGSRS
jgi:hypothetical protein